MTTTMDIYAKRNGFSIEGAKATVIKHMASEPIRRIGKLEVIVEDPSPARSPATTRYSKKSP